jgi:hypothetical protein
MQTCASQYQDNCLELHQMLFWPQKGKQATNYLIITYYMFR